MAALVLAVALVQHSPALRRHARAFERQAARRHVHFVDRVFADHFQRGNVHAHSTRSDGSASFEAMVRWYREHGYQFLAMTEHNLRVTDAELDAPGFVLIPGEEVTDHAGSKPVHVNALCATQEVRGADDFRRVDLALTRILGAVRDAGGFPLVNHPNFHWAFEAEDVERGATGRYLLEVWSGHPGVNARGDVWHPSEEAIWDQILAAGGDAIPAAVDDAHGLPDDPKGGDALPGRGWIETFGGETTAKAICDAIGAGQLYASNGAAIAKIEVDEATFTVTPTEPGAVVTFLGERGEVLKESRAADAPVAQERRDVAYRLKGGEVIVRARVTGTDGKQAWTAAYRVEG